MIEVENTDVNIVRKLIPMRTHMPVSAYGLKAISDWFVFNMHKWWYCLQLSEDMGTIKQAIPLPKF